MATPALVFGARILHAASWRQPLPARVASSSVSTAAGRSWAPGEWRPCHERCHQGLKAVRMMQDLLGHCDAHELHRIRLFTHDGWRTLLLGITNRVALTMLEVHTNYLRHKTLANVGQLLENMYLFLGKANMYLYLSIYSISIQ